MVASSDAFRSTQVQAISVSGVAPNQLGVAHSAGQPDQGIGRWIGGGGMTGAPCSTSRPLGSPGFHSVGPTVAGGTSAGSFGFGVISPGGRIERGRSETRTAKAYYAGRDCVKWDAGGVPPQLTGRPPLDPRQVLGTRNPSRISYSRAGASRTSSIAWSIASWRLAWVPW